ncbi:pyocin S6 family toxin immunity protein [Klebsiella quasivariicola]|uniref:pyocin S6 family toxin immunity protein n=1 Tax=Klebsiella quasivariicola TaxID=2026240 RepID=UPI00247978CA|nr:pyocin S6 family toxin immunity protein [Klebsiella quasivariicola]
MTVVYTIDAFERVDELLVFEVDIPKEKLADIAKVMVWTYEDYCDFTAGIGGWDLTSQQVKAIEEILGKQFFQEDLDFQISAGEL